MCGLLVACATEEATRISEEVSYEVVDMSGNWEKDYQLSDDFDTEFNLFIFDIQRRLNPQSDNLNRSPSLSVGQASGSRETIIGLARFTEEITRMPLLQIEQDRSRMRIDREDDFSLLCEFFNEQTAITQTPFGSEECGWNGEQLLFQLILDDGLIIFYQITLSPNGQQLNITTTVSSASVSTPMTISNYYRRYDIPENEFDCILTLTRNNVCRRANN
ncbi:hypothetical protein N9E57_04365 [Gammaproteobacteria bacterium]|nr:hypothetical protein [Gammaproteobacteria bacterium]